MEDAAQPTRTRQSSVLAAFSAVRSNAFENPVGSCITVTFSKEKSMRPVDRKAAGMFSVRALALFVVRAASTCLGRSKVMDFLSALTL